VYDFYSCTTGPEVWLVLAALYDYSHYMEHVQRLFFVTFSCKNAKFRKEVLLILKYLLKKWHHISKFVIGRFHRFPALGYVSQHAWHTITPVPGFGIQTLVYCLGYYSLKFQA